MNIRRRANAIRGAACFGAALFLESLAAEAQEFVLHTGGTEPLVTDSHLFEAVSGPNVFLRFDFGMATAEEPLAGSFLDSVTFSLEGASSGVTTIFATQDTSGVSWAPPVPGGISLNPASITWTEIAFPSIALGLPNRHAYSISGPIPTELLGQDLVFRIDLFDNGNGVNSTVFGNSLQFVAVPEPQTIGLATGLGLVGAAFLCKLNRRNK